MRRIRVLQILSSFGWGGAQRMAMHLMTNSDSERFEVAAVSLFDRRQTDIEQKLDAAGIQVWYQGKVLGPDFRMIARIQRVVKQFNPDVVHTHGAVLRYVLPALWLLRRREIVHTIHNIAAKEVDALGRVIHGFAFRSGLVTPVSIAKEVAASMTELYGVMHPVLIPNGIPTSDYANVGRRSTIRSDLGLRDDEIMFLTVGRLEAQKNQRLLLQSLAEVRKNLTAPVCVFIAGTGSLDKELKDEAESLGIRGCVRFLGNRTDVPDLLQAADAFALSSEWEGNPLCLMEAMAAGKPVVATAVGGVPELVTDGESGLLVPPGSVQALAHAMLSLASSAALREKLGSCAGEIATQRFDVAQMARAYEKLYLQKCDAVASPVKAAAC